MESFERPVRSDFIKECVSLKKNPNLISKVDALRVNWFLLFINTYATRIRSLCILPDDHVENSQSREI